MEREASVTSRILESANNNININDDVSSLERYLQTIPTFSPTETPTTTVDGGDTDEPSSSPTNPQQPTPTSTVGECDGVITFIDLSAPDPGNDDQQLILNYEIGETCGYEAELFQIDCSSTITDVDITPSDPIEVIDNSKIQITLQYSIDKDDIESSTIWNADTSQVELCVAFTILDENGVATGTEKRQVFIDWTGEGQATPLPTRPPIVQTPPVNDACSASIDMESLPYTASGTTQASTADFTSDDDDLLLCGADDTANGVWYSYTPTQDEVITVNVDAGQVLRVYNGECDELVCLSDDDTNSAGDINLSGTQDLEVLQDVTYYFLVSRQSFSVGSAFTIEARQDGGGGGGPAPTLTPTTVSPQSSSSPTTLDEEDEEEEVETEEPTGSPTVTPTEADEDEVTREPTKKPVTEPMTREPSMDPTVTPTESEPFVSCSVCAYGLTVDPSTPVGGGGKTCADLLVDAMAVDETSQECMAMMAAIPTCCPDVVTTAKPTPRPTAAYVPVTPSPVGYWGSVQTSPSADGGDDVWGSPPDDVWGSADAGAPTTWNNNDCASSKASKMFKWGWGSSSSDGNEWGSSSKNPPPVWKSKSSKCHGKAAKAASSWDGKTHKWGNDGLYNYGNNAAFASGLDRIQTTHSEQQHEPLGLGYRIRYNELTSPIIIDDQSSTSMGVVGGSSSSKKTFIIVAVVGFCSWLGL